jgi:hypothetical protein
MRYGRKFANDFMGPHITESHGACVYFCTPLTREEDALIFVVIQTKERPCWATLWRCLIAVFVTVKLIDFLNIRLSSNSS